MCGIAGIFSFAKNSPDVIGLMTDAVRHRGPDAQAFFRSPDGVFELGHNRLRIIDLSDQANQPMTSHDGRYTIVFNGEIYNFNTLREELLVINPGIQFSTESDTETILCAFSQWGVEMVNKLDGMFAIALADTLSQTLYLFRDPMGKKPLFYYSDTDYFVFGSEIKALLEHPVVQKNKSINHSVLQTFLHLGYIPEPDTIFKELHKFPAGSWGRVGPDLSLEHHTYWEPKPEVSEPTPYVPTGQAVAGLKVALENAVSKRLISDVPLGAFLSGGTDSALVTAITARLMPSSLKTFNIGFGEDPFNESVYARAVAKELKTDHHEYTLTDKEASGLLETYLHHFDEPFADTSAIPTMLVSKLAKQDVTVALTGDGGDELFLGYGAYDWANRLEYPPVRWMQPLLSSALRGLGNNRLKRISSLLEPVPPSKIRSHIFSQEQYYFTEEEIRSHLLIHQEPQSFSYSDDPNLTLNGAEKQALFDIKYYLKDDLLVKVDRSSMYYALECRCPFLDREVVHLALNLPYKFKKRDGERKWILKQWLKEYLPDELIFRPKKGFGIPLHRWLRGDLKYLLHDYLSEEVIDQLGLFKKDYILELVKRFHHGEWYLFNRLWLIIVLHKWIKENA